MNSGNDKAIPVDTTTANGRLPTPHEALIDLAQSLGLEPDDLADQVHEVCSRAANAAYNHGLDAQIEMLLAGFSTGEVETIIRDAAADRADGDEPPGAPSRNDDPTRVLRVVATTQRAVSDDLLDRLADAAARRDGTIARAAAADLDETGAEHGFVYTADTTMDTYEADLAELRQILNDAGAEDYTFVYVRIVEPAMYEREALDT